MRRLTVTLALVLVGAASLGSSGGARIESWPTCPTDPKAAPTTLWVKNYPTGARIPRGSTWCKDGGTATVKLVGYLQDGKASGYSWSLTINGGLCTNTKNGRYIQFGTRVSPRTKRKATDPPGIFVNDPTKASGLDKWAEVGKGAANWAENATIKWSGLKATFTGVEGQWINNVYTQVKATGTVTCRRLVPVTWG
jgi:hypothetical protein